MPTYTYSPCQAEWARGSDETFLSGSLAQPRGIDVYRAEHGNGGGVRAAGRLLDDNVTLTSTRTLRQSQP